MAIKRIALPLALLGAAVSASYSAAGDLPTEVGAHKPGKVLVLPNGATEPTVEITVMEDPADGWNLHIVTTNFRFAPENVGDAPREGEGHAHLYINGEKVTRVYGPWFRLEALPSGACEVAVTLNANDHRILAIGDRIISASEIVQIP